MINTAPVSFAAQGFFYLFFKNLVLSKVLVRLISYRYWVRKINNNVMNYSKHYKLLIERAKTRQLNGYFEKHHIVPRCLGGTNDPDNLVSLTPEEHYVAHQLLVKMYPDNEKLVYAAIMMIPSNTTTCRNNKCYGWVKKKYQGICKQRIGIKNPSYGRRWYHDPFTLANGKFKEDEIPEGWELGRVPNRNTVCEVCGEDTKGKMSRFCERHRKEHKRNSGCYEKSGKTYRKRKNKEDYDRFFYAITTSTTWKEAIRKAGYKTDGYSRDRLYRFAEENSLSLKAD
mgnify:CR=1 FL=1